MLMPYAIADESYKLAEEPRPDGVLKFKGMGAEYCIRMGDYRLSS